MIGLKPFHFGIDLETVLSRVLQTVNSVSQTGTMAILETYRGNTEKIQAIQKSIRSGGIVYFKVCLSLEVMMYDLLYKVPFYMCILKS